VGEITVTLWEGRLQPPAPLSLFRKILVSPIPLVLLRIPF
jgi:hypothetical protein